MLQKLHRDQGEWPENGRLLLEWNVPCHAAMSIRSHRDLEAWQLCDQVRRRFYDITERERVRHNRDFCGQAKRASNSACRNVAEGFYRYGHREFANFVNISKGSIGELFDSSDEALIEKYVDAEEHKTLNELLERAKDALGGLHRHLRSTPTPKPRNPGPPRR